MAERESSLESASDIYRPFDAPEVKRLRNFVGDVEGLASSALFTNPTNTVRISGEVDQPITQELDFAGDEAVHAVVGRFRQIYNQHEPTSYASMMKLLSMHVYERDSPLQREALDEIKALRKWEKEARDLKGGVEINVNGETMTGPILIDLFLHGHYLHKGNEKSDQLEVFPLRAMLLSEFIRAMSVLMGVYWVGRNVVAQILQTPSLLPPRPPVG